MTSDRGLVQSLDRALSILDVLRYSSEPLALGEIAGRSGLPKSTTHRLLSTLEVRGFVARDPTAGSYRLGLKSVTPAGAGPEIRTVLTELATRSGETANLGTLVGREVLYVDRADSPHALRWQLGVGSRVPVHCSGLGKAILAFIDPGDIARHLSKRLPAQTSKTITDRGAFLAELPEIRRRGFALDQEEFMEGVRCIGVPILGAEGEVLGAISLAGPAFRFTEPAAMGQAAPLRAAATRIRALLGAEHPVPAVLRDAP